MNRIGRILGILGAAIFLAAALPATGTAKAPPKSVTFKAKPGNVTFPHQKHYMALHLKCTTCHHKGVQAGACTNCHKAKAEGKKPSLKDAMHTRCKGCHEKELATHPKAPVKCMQCHKH